MWLIRWEIDVEKGKEPHFLTLRFLSSCRRSGGDSFYFILFSYTAGMVWMKERRRNSQGRGVFLPKEKTELERYLA